MKELFSCKQAIESCSSSRTFAIAHLYKEEKAMDMHIHDCYEIYYSISGGRQFLIDQKFYTIEPGDIFVINQYESHKLTQVDSMVHERIVLSIHPEYTKKLSTPQTNLDACFSGRTNDFSHKISFSKEYQNRFLYFINKITNADGYGQDIIEQSAFMEMMLMVNSAVLAPHESLPLTDSVYNRQVDDILAYINQNIASPISIQQLAEKFFLSESYICRIFKSSTGTTINKYINARRISIAKALLNDGESVMEAYEKSGFTEAYINQNIASPISIQQLAEKFFLSESYICRIFKSSTGTTINKYINARRISIAKALLNDGESVMEAYEKSGFTDYSNFFKTFTKAVGISPKKYAQCSVSVSV